MEVTQIVTIFIFIYNLEFFLLITYYVNKYHKWENSFPLLRSEEKLPSYAVFGRSPFADLYLNFESLWSCAYSCRQALALSPYDHAHSFHISDESVNKLISRPRLQYVRLIRA